MPFLRSRMPRIAAILTLTTAMLFAVIGRADESSISTETIAVKKTYNDRPFDYAMKLLDDRTDFQVYRLSYPSPVVTPVEQNNTVPADYYLPKNLQPGIQYPAVICLHILNGDEQLTDLMCSVLASRGIPAISFKMPYYGERGVAQGPEAMADNPAMFVGAISQVGEDIRRTIDLLASRPEVDPERIGITGISLGGITGATAAGAEPRLHRACLILAGGDLLPLIRHARETRELCAMIDKLAPQERSAIEAKITEVDPLQFAPALRRRAQEGRVLMINAGDDEVVPRACTDKLAQALGIADRVVWFEGLGHYTAMAELPRAMRMTADFFAQDLPESATTAKQNSPKHQAQATPLGRFVSVLQQLYAMISDEPDRGRCHFVDLDVTVNMPTGEEFKSRVRFVRGSGNRFLLHCNVPVLGDVAIGQNDAPWMLGANEKLLVGTKNRIVKACALDYIEPQHVARFKMARGIGGGVIMAPEMLRQWITIEDDAANAEKTIRLAAKDQQQMPGEVHLRFSEDGKTPAAIEFDISGVRGKMDIRGWQVNTVAPDALFDPPEGQNRQEVDQVDLHRMFAAMLNFAIERLDSGRNLGPVGQPGPVVLISRDPQGHGMLCRTQGKLILFLEGTPEEMGAAHGALLGPWAQKMNERAVYLIGCADTLQSGRWFFDTIGEIQRRTTPFIDPRYFEECDSLARASTLSERDGRCANLFPERFHCSGLAVRGKATADGRVLHARVLDYMRDIDLQEAAVVQVFMPKGRNAWMSHGYAGLIGTVTCMNEKGLAIGEMGGRGLGQWDGTPMTILMRDIMERAATTEEAVDMFRKASRTCEYYYVVSDKSGKMRALECTHEKCVVLEPGQQNPRLPHIPEETVLISGGDRAKLLSQRVEENYGRIDVPRMIEMIKRPVAMSGNLHDAIFAPETLDMWFSDAGKYSNACDEPYAHLNLQELLRYYAKESILEEK